MYTVKLEHILFITQISSFHIIINNNYVTAKANSIHEKHKFKFSLFFIFTLKQPKMEWTRAKDVMLAKEVLYLEPFQFKERTNQSVQAWQEITSKLITNYPGDFGRLISRGGKDHVGLLIRNPK